MQESVFLFVAGQAERRCRGEEVSLLLALRSLG